jgi:hypothetical protein
MLPSVGRIVHYNLSGQIFAAIITRVHENGTVALQVFYVNPRDEQRLIPVAGAEQDVTTGAPDVSKWAWPPRVP